MRVTTYVHNYLSIAISKSTVRQNGFTLPNDTPLL